MVLLVPTLAVTEPHEMLAMVVAVRLLRFLSKTMAIRVVSPTTETIRVARGVTVVTKVVGDRVALRMEMLVVREVRVAINVGNSSPVAQVTVVSVAPVAPGVQLHLRPVAVAQVSLTA